MSVGGEGERERCEGDGYEEMERGRERGSGREGNFVVCFDSIASTQASVCVCVCAFVCMCVCVCVCVREVSDLL